VAAIDTGLVVLAALILVCALMALCNVCEHRRDANRAAPRMQA